MPLETNRVEPQDLIADGMVAFLRTVPALNQPEILIDNPVDITRVVDKMTVGQLLFDVWPVGAAQLPLNRTQSRWEYEIHLGVRCKVEAAEKQLVRTLGWYRAQAQAAFGPKFKMSLPDGSTAHLLKSEPFAPFSREALRERFVYVSPILFVWARSAPGG